MKKLAIGAAVAALTLGLAAAPSSAGYTQSGNLVATPDPVEQGSSTVISNADDAASTCEDGPLPSALAGQPSIVDLLVEDPGGATIVDTTVVPDSDGNWSYPVENLDTVGTYTMSAICRVQPNPTAVSPAHTAGFQYFEGEFEVIAQVTTTEAPTTTAVPTSTTAAATDAVAATPSYTG